MGTNTTEDLLRLNQRLLVSIAEGDWATYQELCDPTLTAFEPEALGQRVEGLEFHHFYFLLGGRAGKHQSTMCNPHVRLIGDVAVVTYIRLNQSVSATGDPVSSGSQETRIWQKKEGRWWHVHFHRTALPQPGSD